MKTLGVTRLWLIAGVIALLAGPVVLLFYFHRAGGWAIGLGLLAGGAWALWVGMKALETAAPSSGSGKSAAGGPPARPGKTLNPPD